ncbi:MAG: MBL fold metallo-hydrolase [Oscillospiraceae bacterium]|jgi:phosphoribosyl 1,2-cyclic phosphodiesterase|nr:MBL fold metallo-hydrolase [Oscillospiraceae bacterium]
MARICPLFSGSTGNSTYIGCASGGVLIDAGVGARSICGALGNLGVDIKHVSAVFVTHEHTDHIRGLPTLAKKHGIKIYASEKTAQALAPVVNARVIDGQGVQAGDMLITRFDTSHDCPGSGGYVVTTPDGHRIGVCTDLGHVSDEVRSALTGCDAVLIESNHDVNMLKNGSYPYHTKLRILSERGHLSNACCADELPALIKNGLTRVILGHISRDNNFPELALTTARTALLAHGMRENSDYLIWAAPPAGGRLVVV